MDTKTALGAAGGISLTVVGAVSALVLTLGGGSATVEQSPTNGPIVEYVDQYGNPIALQQPAAAVPEIVITTEGPASVDEGASTGDLEMMAAPEPAAPADEAYEDHDEHEEGEYEGAEEEDDD